MELAALFSGGKDSTYALYKVMKEGHKIKYLVSVFPSRQDSWMFHYPGIELTKLQAKRMGIEQVIVKTIGIKEHEVLDLKKALERLDVDGVVTGALASVYQKSRIDKICKELGLKSLSPLWHKDPIRLIKASRKAGFRAIITAVAAYGLDYNWLGREIDDRCLEDLKKLNKKYGIHIGFEGGEAESFVYDCPLFSKPVKIIKTKKIWDGVRGHLEILEAK